MSRRRAAPPPQAPTLLLADVAAIRAGYPFRARIEPDRAGAVSVIQMRDVDYPSASLRGTPYRVAEPANLAAHLLTESDILFVAKGTSNVAVAFDPALAPAVAASSFFVIALTDPRLLPAFVAWYINQTPAQRYLQGSSRGSGVQLIAKGILERLALPIPPLKTQQAILQLDRLARRERELADRIAIRRRRLIEMAALAALR